MAANGALARQRPAPLPPLLECAAIRQDIYEDGAIIEHPWHEDPSDAFLKAVYEEAVSSWRCRVGSSSSGGREIE